MPTLSESTSARNRSGAGNQNIVKPDRDGSGYDAPPPTHSESTLTRNGMGADIQKGSNARYESKAPIA